jgi:hypothetical protein
MSMLEEFQSPVRARAGYRSHPDYGKPAEVAPAPESPWWKHLWARVKSIFTGR